MSRLRIKLLLEIMLKIQEKLLKQEPFMTLILQLMVSMLNNTPLSLRPIHTMTLFIISVIFLQKREAKFVLKLQSDKTSNMLSLFVN